MARQKGGKGGPAPGDKRQSDSADEAKLVSGKWVIVGIALLALFAAGASWWFRYSATHRAAQFWGPEAAVLIREAPLVQLVFVEPMGPDHVHNSGQLFADHYHAGDGLWQVVDRIDISKAPGLTHLRTALLGDSSLRPLDDQQVAPSVWQGGLEFHSSFGGYLVVLFSPDCDVMMRHMPGQAADRVEQTGVIAEALRDVFDEWRRKHAAAGETAPAVGDTAPAAGDTAPAAANSGR